MRSAKREKQGWLQRAGRAIRMFAIWAVVLGALLGGWFIATVIGWFMMAIIAPAGVLAIALILIFRRPLSKILGWMDGHERRDKQR